MLNKIRTMLTPSINTGVADDNRPDYLREKDYTAEEVLPAFGNFDYSTLPTKVQVGYSVRNQGWGNTCVANAGAKCLEILDTTNTNMYSASPIYKPRVNAPGAGMIGYDVLNIMMSKPMFFETDVPSEQLTDQQVDSIVIPAGGGRGNPLNSYIIGYDRIDFDVLASAVLTHKCAIIYVNTNRYAWTSVPPVSVRDDSLRHGVAAVDVIWDPITREPHIIIEDSWGKFDNSGIRFDLKPGQRALSRSFIENHVYFAGGVLNFKYAGTNEVIIQPGVLKFTVGMKFGEKSENVKMLQRKLLSLGLFPKNIPISGYYGNITRTGVYLFQVKYGVAPLPELNSLKGRVVGPKTLAKLNTF